jgi:hypothetical protein
VHGILRIPLIFFERSRKVRAALAGLGEAFVVGLRGG